MKVTGYYCTGCGTVATTPTTCCGRGLRRVAGRASTRKMLAIRARAGAEAERALRALAGAEGLTLRLPNGELIELRDWRERALFSRG